MCTVGMVFRFCASTQVVGTVELCTVRDRGYHPFLPYLKNHYYTTEVSMILCLFHEQIGVYAQRHSVKQSCRSCPRRLQLPVTQLTGSHGVGRHCRDIGKVNRASNPQQGTYI